MGSETGKRRETTVNRENQQITRKLEIPVLDVTRIVDDETRSKAGRHYDILSNYFLLIIYTLSIF